MTPPRLTIITPTFDNYSLLHQYVNSLIQNTALHPEEPEWHLLVVNNGREGGVTRNLSPHPAYSVIEAGGNKGWEGGLAIGLTADVNGGRSEYVMFANDDLHIVPGNPLWLHRMMDTLDEHPEIGAVGPVSNFVMGAQHMHYGLGPMLYECKLLIGFCVMVRRSALDKVGGVTQGLVGGDDFDLSLRLAAGGYRMAIQGDVFVFHHGCTTGTRVHSGYWNSQEHINETRNDMIRRHKLRPYMNMIRFQPKPYA